MPRSSDVQCVHCERWFHWNDICTCPAAQREAIARRDKRVCHLPDAVVEAFAQAMALWHNFEHPGPEAALDMVGVEETEIWCGLCTVFGHGSDYPADAARIHKRMYEIRRELK